MHAHTHARTGTTPPPTCRPQRARAKQRVIFSEFPVFGGKRTNTGNYTPERGKCLKRPENGQSGGTLRGEALGGPEGVGFSVPIVPILLTITRTVQAENIPAQQMDVLNFPPELDFFKVNYIYFTGCIDYTNQQNNKAINQQTQ